MWAPEFEPGEAENRGLVPQFALADAPQPPASSSWLPSELPPTHRPRGLASPSIIQCLQPALLQQPPGAFSVPTPKVPLPLPPSPSPSPPPPLPPSPPPPSETGGRVQPIRELIDEIRDQLEGKLDTVGSDIATRFVELEKRLDNIESLQEKLLEKLANLDSAIMKISKAFEECVWWKLDNSAQQPSEAVQRSVTSLGLD